MKTYGFMIVKNEADILTQTIEALCKYGSFEKIFISNYNLKGLIKDKFKIEIVTVSKIEEVFSLLFG